LRAVGIANQRETALLWNRRTGEPVYPAIVWQDRRTSERCRELPHALIRKRTGLLPDPYFSATKLQWLLEHAARGLAADSLAFGTVDAWLVWKLTGGRCHATDITNASRTMLLDLARLDWDDELLGLFAVPREILPAIVPSSGIVAEVELLGATLPLAGLAGDQQAALFGQACHTAGQAKATYGTGAFLLVHAGERLDRAVDGLLVTAACCLPSVAPEYALEGPIFVAGAALQWLQAGLGLLDEVEQADAVARSLPGNEGVYFVPALVGLGAPHWAPEARGLLTGLTPASGRAHLVRAALEAIAYQTRDVLEATPVPIAGLRVDGGVAANDFAMQFLADIIGAAVEVAAEREATALGAAGLAGLAVGAFASRAELAARWRCGTRYLPTMDRAEADGLHAEWRDAVARTLPG
jgi:glycerol kinase